jgi:class 3 adenylate cyclase
LHCAAKIIADFGGEITAYDGDRVMAVFIGERKNTRAARSALTINYAVNEIIRPACKAQYQNTDYVLKHVVGIDTSDLFVARTGVRGANDLVWVGNAANVAAKLSSLSSDYPTYITERVYKALAEDAKTSAGQSMWERAIWSGFDQSIIYRSTWQWPLA